MARRKKKDFEYTRHNQVTLVRGGAPYFGLLEELIDKANSSIHLQTYIFDSDETGQRIANALIRAARRNVTVYVLLDGYASRHLSPGIISRWKSSGIQFSFFEPLFRSNNFYIGRRMHHKILAVDGLHALVGGINISNRYNDFNGIPAWLDWAVHATGETGPEIEAYCCYIWNGSQRRRPCATLPPTHLPEMEECLVRIRVNDWIQRRMQVYQSYMHLFGAAREEVILLSSYFWPGRKLLRKMFDAAARGVKIKLILTGVSDVRIAKSAERYIYRRLFRHGIEVYEYGKTVLHGKMAVADGQLVTIGSYNVNNISAYASMELNLDINNEPFANTVAQRMKDIIANDCVQVTDDTYLAKYTPLRRFSYLLAYEAVHFIFLLFTFYFRQTKKLKQE
ncbi:MAG: phospholipase [Flavipsychrobacter sp.]|nr:phospholipase [Flavipsychrobacter sp.]